MLTRIDQRGPSPSIRLYKDAGLDALALHGNVAQFVSYAPDPRGGLVQRYARVSSHPANYRFGSIAEAVDALLASAGEGSLNVRSYDPNSPRSREFVYGLRSVEDVVETVDRLAREGLHLIVNETIDVGDGGVSGVVSGDVVEFAPDDTPRCVERSGTASMPLSWAYSILETVYGFKPDLGDGRGRLEFSVHPSARGWRREHTIAWEFEDSDPPTSPATLSWPNDFSRLLGDKAFGLLVADRLGLKVPATTAVGRRVRPYGFGAPTGSSETWIRTCPREPDPGRFTTRKGWTDPFALLAKEDAGHLIASVLCQAAVPARHSGAAIVTVEGALAIEGVAGEGDHLMLGTQRPEALPSRVVDDVVAAYGVAKRTLGPVRFEWVHDGDAVWVVQLHRGATTSSARVLVPGEASSWREIDASSGLEPLRRTIGSLPAGTGLVLRGEVGITSHIADLVRRAGVPTRVRPG